ncbi:MAG: tetratricopeptide repeat protein [Desulfobacteraceae bacterium]|nr:tetratricopeptide repeat protein [Desulfobacteraceae bacterium]
MPGLKAKKQNRANQFFEQGNVFLAADEFDRAISAYSQALKLNFRMSECHFNSGVVYHHKGNLDKAVSHYKQAIRFNPGLTQAHFNLAHAFSDLNQTDLAARLYRSVLAHNPGHVEAAYNLANLYQGAGLLDQALKAYENVIRINVNYTRAWNNLGVIHLAWDQLKQAELCFRQALISQPEMHEAYYNLGIVCQKQGRFEAGLDYYAKALSINPEYPCARWLHALSLPMLYSDKEQIWQARKRFTTNLDRLIANTFVDTAEQKRLALEAIATTANFYLQYQGKNDRDLQKKYGDFAAIILAANFPEWSLRRPMPPVGQNSKIRIGYVSSLMYSHTIGAFLLGWLTHHDRQSFEIYCYHVGNRTDALTGWIKGQVDHFYHLPGSFEIAANQIYGDDLHFLIHTDIGMNPVTLLLAGLRLAPVQCKGWGHPVTTGLPTIDYYLTSELMEPENEASHYTEKTIRLPNLALSHSAPRLPARPRGRDFFGFPENRIIYLSTQSLFKYLPQHDDIYPQIAKQVPNALFVFIAHSSDYATGLFKQRLANAFHREGLDARTYCRFADRLNHPDFLSLNLAADVLLDTLDWSGGKTCLEALWCGLPLVTLPGEFMRGRHAYAFLKRIDLPETIAEDKNDYIRIAAQIGLDRNFQCKIREHIQNKKHLLFNDGSVIKSLEAFLKKEYVQYCLPKNKVYTKSDDPAKYHHGQGLELLNEGKYGDALISFEKAIAWIPNHLGVNPWFQKYLLNGNGPVDYQPGFIAQIYVDLAQSQAKLDRLEDSLQSCKAALRFEPCHRQAADYYHQIVNQACKYEPMQSKPLLEQSAASIQAPVNLLNKLTLLVVTNFTKKLKHNRHLSPPGLGLLEKTWSSLLQVAGKGLAGQCPKFLALDLSMEPAEEEKKYKTNLARFACRHGFSFYAFEYSGLQFVIKTMLEKITTPYFMLIEHDWQFMLPFVDINLLLALFESRRQINYIRFNKRNNIIAGYDVLMKRETRWPQAKLIQTVCHSNNPSIRRTDVFKDTWLPICFKDPLCRVSSNLRGTAFGIEEPLFKQYLVDVRQMGFTKAHEKWGVYVYGDYETAPKIIH